MLPVIRYTSARIAFFVVTTGILYLVTPMRGIFLLLVAVLISGLISYVLLSGQRDAMSSTVLSSARKRRDKFNAARTSEDPPDTD